jgi:hypothetical protein
VALANPVAGYGSFHTNIAFNDMGDSEQAPADMATIADYAHLTAMRAPRPTLLTYNAKDDCCFQSGHTLEPLLEAARPAFALYGAEDRLRSHVNHVPGTHNFEQENREKLYAAVGDFFYSGDGGFVRAEIPSETELKTADELHVPLPDDNVDFHRLAEALVQELPRQADLPINHATAVDWQREMRDRLRTLLGVEDYGVASEASSRLSGSAKEVVLTLPIKVGGAWTVPATMVFRPNYKRAVMLVADGGAAEVADEIERLAGSENLVIAVDPLFFGQAKVNAQDSDYTYALFISTVGERALGIQAAQLAAIARGIKKGSKENGHELSVAIRAVGPRASMAALVAAAVEPDAVDAAELSGALVSLKQLIEADKPVEELPGLFPFGLLAEFDVRHLVALCAPRPIIFQESSERARRELEPLVAWYALFDSDFDPLR